MGDYVRLGSVDTWYEVEGDGDPVVLLHGGMSDGSAWGAQTPALAERYRVYRPDRRGHGRTADTDDPFGYDEMAAETIDFLQRVVGGPAHLVGWSDGGITALLAARARPDLVRRQVLMGVNFHFDGMLGDSANLGEDPETPALAVFKDAYVALTPDGPQHWPVFFAKTGRLWLEEPTLTVEDLARIEVPSLVLVGDDEPIRFDHTVALYENLPNGQLAVVPGASHLFGLEKPDLTNRLIVDFLGETEPPATFWAIRRAAH
jgi:pimeloyl-ACP methyl ester carboxylesterase